MVQRVNVACDYSAVPPRNALNTTACFCCLFVHAGQGLRSWSRPHAAQDRRGRDRVAAASRL
jgi:hypothetical protein